YQRGIFPFERTASPPEIIGGAAALVGFLPARRLGNIPPDPKHDKGRQDADQIHVSPSVGPGRANRQPPAGGQNASDRVSRVQKGTPLAARAGWPKLRRD